MNTGVLKVFFEFNYCIKRDGFDVKTYMLRRMTYLEVVFFFSCRTLMYHAVWNFPYLGQTTKIFRVARLIHDIFRAESVSFSSHSLPSALFFSLFSIKCDTLGRKLRGRNIKVLSTLRCQDAVLFL